MTARLLVEDERPVAYGELWFDAEEDEVELARIIVAPDARGRGLGRVLVRGSARRGPQLRTLGRVHAGAPGQRPGSALLPGSRFRPRRPGADPGLERRTARRLRLATAPVTPGCRSSRSSRGAVGCRAGRGGR
ncbi:GNAT family N-acetyltransferase [Streptomyces sp. GTA36]